jgi:hypothetical protein
VLQNLKKIVRSEIVKVNGRPPFFLMLENCSIFVIFHYLMRTIFPSKFIFRQNKHCFYVQVKFRPIKYWKWRGRPIFPSKFYVDVIFTSTLFLRRHFLIWNHQKHWRDGRRVIFMPVENHEIKVKRFLCFFAVKFSWFFRDFPHLTRPIFPSKFYVEIIKMKSS